IRQFCPGSGIQEEARRRHGRRDQAGRTRSAGSNRKSAYSQSRSRYGPRLLQKPRRASRGQTPSAAGKRERINTGETPQHPPPRKSVAGRMVRLATIAAILALVCSWSTLASGGINLATVLIIGLVAGIIGRRPSEQKASFLDDYFVWLTCAGFFALFA